MTGPAVILLLALATGLGVLAVLVGADIAEDRRQERKARKDWERIVALSEKRRHLSNTSPRSIP